MVGKFENIVEIRNVEEPLYKKILKQEEDIYIWGEGTLAKRVYSYCMHYNIHIKGCFVNIEKEKKGVEGLTVYVLDELLNKKQKFSVIIGHSNYQKGIEYLSKFEKIEKIFCLPSVCYNMWNKISYEFLKNNTKNINQLYEKLEDLRSKECLKAYFEARINEDASYMFPYFDNKTTYYKNDIITLTEEEILLDIGAGTGDTIEGFVNAVGGKFEKIIALEPEHKNFELLKDCIYRNNIENVILQQICANNKNENVIFMGNGEIGGINGCETEIIEIYEAKTIDSLVEKLELEKPISIIKINFPFSVSEVLEGAKNVLRKGKPKIIIRIGFDENVILSAYCKILEYNPNYKLYFRYTVGIPQGLTLFAI